MSKDAFKKFVAKNPILITKVKNEETTWQKLYEIYNLYEEDEKVWKSYLESSDESKEEDTNKNFNTSSIMDSFGDYLKNVDMAQVQSGITNIQKVLGLVSDLFIKDSTGIDASLKDSSYVPRAINNRLDD